MLNYPTSFPLIISEDLTLRDFKSSDVDQVFQVYSDPKVAEYDDFDPIDHPSEAKEIIKSILHQFRQRDQIRWAITRTNESSFIGSCGLMDFDPDNQKCIIGYDLLKEEWGKGIVTRAIAMVCQYAFQEMNLHRIEAYVTPGNLGSYRVLEKNGFIQEGHLRQMEFYKGQFQDGILYAKLSIDP